MNPHAREDDVIVEELLDEVMVYDRKGAKAHCLNRTAAFVWRHSDGRSSVAELAVRLHQELGVPADEELVWLALDRLEKAHLLHERLERPAVGAGVSRRQVMRKLGVAGGLSLLLPVVTSIVAPAPAMAQSAVPCHLPPVGNCIGTCPPGQGCFLSVSPNLHCFCG